MGIFKNLFGGNRNRTGAPQVPALKESDSVFGQTTLGNLALLSSYLGKGGWKSNQAVYVTTSAVTDAGRVIDISTLTRNSTVLSCVNYKARTLAQLPIEVYWKSPDGRYVNAMLNESIGSRDYAKAKQICTLLECPNNFQSRYEWVYQLSMHLDLLGESFTLWWRKDQNDPLQNPIELYQLDPTLVTVVVNDMRYPQYRLSSPSYGFKGGDGNELSYWQCMHLKEAGWQGSSGFNKGTKAVELISLDQSIDFLANYFMENSPKIGGVFSTENSVPQGKWEEMATRIKEQFAKFSGANTDRSQPGQAMMLDNGMNFIATQMPNLQSGDIAKLKQQTTNRICGLYGVPPQLIGNSEGKFNNTETLISEFYKSTLMPLLSNLEAKLTQHLFKGYPNLCVHFNTDNILKGSPTEQANYVIALKNAGIMTANEARCYLGMGGHEDEKADELSGDTAKEPTDPIKGSSPQDTGGGGGSNLGQPKLKVVGGDDDDDA